MKECKIVEDLLPLYEEDLLQPDSKDFIEEHLKHCEDCRKIVAGIGKPLPTFEVKKEPKIIRKIMRKTSLIQFILILLMAVGSAFTAYAVEDGLHFVIIYPIMGALLYGYYRSAWMPLMIAVVTSVIFVGVIPALQMTSLLDFFVEFLGSLIYLIPLLIFFILGFALTKFWNMMTERD